jgi:SAM-dependent methyltransferase
MAEGWEDDYGSVTARYYDPAYAALSQRRGDIAFYRSLAREAAGPVLELGCGTGRVLLEIAAENLPCTGLDTSQEMLDALSRKAAGRGLAVRLVRAAMQSFDLGRERFSLIFSAFRVFQHLCTLEDQLSCLASVRRHLAPGGVFAFDVFNPRLERMAVDEEPEAEDLRFTTPEGIEVVRYASVVRRDRAEQLQFIRFRYEQQRGSEPGASDVVRFRMRWFYRFELEHLLARAGFGPVTLFGDFDRSPVRPGCPEYIAVTSALA